MPDGQQQPTPPQLPPESKVYSLKTNERELLLFIKRQQDAIFSALLSNIAADRLSYPLTERTQFKLTDQMSKLEISELPPDPNAPQGGTPPPPPPPPAEPMVRAAQ